MTIVWLRRAAWLLAAAATAFSVLGRRYGVLEFRPGGSSFDTVVRPIFLGAFVLGLLLSLRWEIAGGILAVFAAAGLVAFATNQLVASHAVAVIAAFAIPGVLWILIDLHDMDRRLATISLAIAGVLAVVGFALGNYGYERVWGPQHPVSELTALPSSPVEWVWSGAVEPTSAQVRAKFDLDAVTATLLVATSPDLADVRRIDAEAYVSLHDGRIVEFLATQLDPATTYHYVVEVDGYLDTTRRGTFRTFPDGAASFTVAIGACARIGSNGQVFEAIRAVDPDLYMIVGDFHYGDTGIDDVADHRDVLDLTLTSPAQASLYRSVPVAYVWDDHDYGANDSDATAPSRPAAMASYRSHVPSYELAGSDSAIFQAFTIGRVRFVMTDARSSRSPKSMADGPDKTMLGEEQKAWFLDEIVDAARTHELVVWVNPVPWIAEPEAGADNWAGYTHERRELANHIRDHGIDNLLMISGDAHMVAIDDGTNTNYSDTPGPAFPLVHSAALDRPGSTKGGPYSHGAVGGAGQFVTLDVIDDGGPLRVRLEALRWDGEMVLDYEFTVPSRSAR